MPDKRCTKCFTEKPITEFGKSGVWGKYTSYCKSCAREYYKEYKKTHPRPQNRAIERKVMKRRAII